MNSLIFEYAAMVKPVDTLITLLLFFRILQIPGASTLIFTRFLYRFNILITHSLSPLHLNL